MVLQVLHVLEVVVIVVEGFVTEPYDVVVPQMDADLVSQGLGLDGVAGGGPPGVGRLIFGWSVPELSDG
jgi:hypothetical protein